MINDLLKICIDSDKIRNSKEIKAPGLLDSHYAPNARVFISGVPQPGDGLIALDNYLTPDGVIRLASPINNEEFARVLYNSFRLGDNIKLVNIYVIPPIGDDIGVAIRDRLQKAAYRN